MSGGEFAGYLSDLITAAIALTALGHSKMKKKAKLWSRIFVSTLAVVGCWQVYASGRERVDLRAERKELRERLDYFQKTTRPTTAQLRFGFDPNRTEEMRDAMSVRANSEGIFTVILRVKNVSDQTALGGSIIVGVPLVCKIVREHEPVQLHECPGCPPTQRTLLFGQFGPGTVLAPITLDVWTPEVPATVHIVMAYSCQTCLDEPGWQRRRVVVQAATLTPTAGSPAK